MLVLLSILTDPIALFLSYQVEEHGYGLFSAVVAPSEQPGIVELGHASELPPRVFTILARRLMGTYRYTPDHVSNSYIYSEVGRIAGQTVLFIGMALLYKRWVTNKRPAFFISPEYSMQHTGDFKQGVFSCCDDVHTCIYACCCSPVRLADTYSTIGVGCYWGFVLRSIVGIVVWVLVGGSIWV